MYEENDRKPALHKRYNLETKLNLGFKIRYSNFKTSNRSVLKCQVCIFCTEGRITCQRASRSDRAGPRWFITDAEYRAKNF